MEAKKEKNEELLNLSLAIVGHSNYTESSSEGLEAKIFKLIKERERMLNIKQKGKEISIKEGNKGLHLIHLLLVTATLINEKNFNSAVDNLIELYRYVSVSGDSGQRVAAYLADGLTSRLITQKSPFYNMLMNKPTFSEEFLAFTHLYRVSPFYQFAHFTANQAILEAFERDQELNNNWALHVIDFDISYGFQWPSLIQSLSEKATSLNHSLSLRITGFGKSLKELIETETRLVSFSNGFHSIVFEFRGLLRGSNSLMNLRKTDNETVAVNLVFHLSSLMDILKISDTLTAVKSLNPSVVVLVEREGSRNSCGFLSSYVDSLHYYAAMFDSLDDCLPLLSAERLSIEKNYLGKEIKEAIGCEKDEMNYLRFDTMETWKRRMESHGFSGINLSSKTMIQAKLLLKMGCHHHHYHPRFEVDGGDGGSGGGGGGFRVYERDNGRAISLGWHDRFLTTVSIWCSYL